ncbi:MAG: class I adenylate-forming enzyme family protein [Rhodoferax sp.]
MTTEQLQARSRRRERFFGDRVVWAHAERAPSVYAGLSRAAQQNPQHTAMVFEGRRWSYLELTSEIGRLAAALRTQGVQPGDRVALWVRNRPEFILMFYAIAAIGAVSVPMDVRLQGAEAGYAIADAGAVLLVHDAELGERLPAVRESAPKCVIVELPDDPLVRVFSQQAESGPPELPIVDPESIAVILYTSGSTGKPKGAAIAHANVVNAALLQAGNFGLDTNDVSLVSVPLSHVTGLICGVVGPLCSGGTLTLLAHFKAREFLAAAQDTGMTYAIMVPAMYNLCLRVEDFDHYDLSSWRIGHFGGAPMPEATIETLQRKLPQLILVNGYGATETCSPAVMTPVGEGQPNIASVGKPLPGVEVIIMDPDTGVEVPVGEPGEIWIRSASVIPRYWNNPQATSQALIGGFWRSGDLGLIDSEGYVYVRDRIKDLINRGGYKIYSAEVESVLYACPGVIEAAIVARPDAVLGERVHAFVNVTDGVTEAQLIAFCAERLADYKVPESWSLVNTALLRNSAGKLDKKVMRAQMAEAPALIPTTSGKKK